MLALGSTQTKELCIWWVRIDLLSETNNSRFLSSSAFHQVNLALLLIASICFYTESTKLVFLALSCVGIIAEMLSVLEDILRSRRVIFEPCVCWLALIYLMFTTYGVLFPRYGDYNWDAMIFNCISGIAVYFSLCGIARSSKGPEGLFTTLSFVALSVLILIVVREYSFFGSSTRLGDSLSGNVNTAGRSLGGLSVFLAFWVMRKGSIGSVTLFSAVCAAILLTGSKGALVFIAADLILIQRMAKSKALANLALIGMIALACVLVFGTPQLYNVLGERLEDAFYQVFGIGPGHYSRSTDSRSGMIKEGLTAFLDYPLFGGGERYFASISSYGYAYSHCNYVELLCNYGIVGLTIFYAPCLYLFFVALRDSFNGNVFAKVIVASLAAFFVADWTTVTYSSIVMTYFPVLVAFVFVRLYRPNRTSESTGVTRTDKVEAWL